MAHEPSRHEREEATQRQALEDLDRLRHEGGGFLGSALAAAGRRAADHFAARDAGDPVERWGRRIGRALSLAAFLALCVYFYLTYLR
jgi:hypothetical protein